jgi:hypothetical protein
LEPDDVTEVRGWLPEVASNDADLIFDEHIQASTTQEQQSAQMMYYAGQMMLSPKGAIYHCIQLFTGRPHVSLVL